MSGGTTTDVLRSKLDTRSEAYDTNRAAFLEQIDCLSEQLELARAGGGEKYVQRHLARGKLMARERIELLLDRDSPFLELAPLAAWGTEFGLGGGSVAGIGVVSGVQGPITAHEPTPKAGTVTQDIETAVREFAAGKLEYRNDAGGNIHLPVGKTDFATADLQENIEAVVHQMNRIKPVTSKGTYVKKISLSATRTPSVTLVVE